MLNGNVKIIHQYLLQKMEESVVYYLQLVLPTVESWKRMEKREKKGYAGLQLMWPAENEGKKK